MYCNRSGIVIYSRTISVWVYQNNGNVSAYENFIDRIHWRGPLLVFGRKDVQAEAKGEFLHTYIAGELEDKEE
jgi:hypothetical protein